MTEVELISLKTEIKEVILQALNIKNIKPEQIGDSNPLFARDNILGLDSIDAIELIMAIQKHFNVRIADQNLVCSHFNGLVPSLWKSAEQNAKR